MSVKTMGALVAAAFAATAAMAASASGNGGADPVAAAVRGWKAARPAKARKVLLFSERFGYDHKDARESGDRAFALAGEVSGAWRIVKERDVKRLADGKYLAEFDAILFNNSTGITEAMAPGLTAALTEYVRGGRGLALIHSGLDAFRDSDEIMDMVGGYFRGHPWHAEGTWRFLNEAGAHPVNASFRPLGVSFAKSDEIYQFPAFFDRSRCKVLVSMDLTDPKTKEAELYWKNRFGDRSVRGDHDYAVSWVKDYGKGRVFYTSFGHDGRAFGDPERLHHMFAGLQYVLGDVCGDIAGNYAADKPLQRTDWAGGPWNEKLEARVKAAQGQTLDFAFLGDSITMGWIYSADCQWKGGKEVWEREFGSMKTLNLGMSGDRTDNVLWRVTDGGQADGWKAKTIFLMIGINNIFNPHPGWKRMDTPEEAARGAKAIVDALKAKHPESCIVLFGALPTGNPRDGYRWVREYNAILSTFAGGKVVFKDIGERFLESPDRSRKDLYRDGLHPNAAGYEVMAREMKKLLAAGDAIHGPDSHPLVGCPQYWTPENPNEWVGDVALGTFEGRLHVFYLKDRNHHGSSEGMGCHIFSHLSARENMTDWMEHPDAVPLDEWWKTVGTGTPFVKDGKLCLAYGYHTERVPNWKELKLPAGATWSSSDDAVHFVPSGVFFHETRNPTVYNRSDGRFGMILGYAGMGGMYVSDDLLKWEPVDEKLPGKGDCPCYFEWNGHHYLLQSFTQMFHSKTGKPGSWEDWAAAGKDVYEGLSVPMVCEIAGGRRIMAGWIRHPAGWGGWLVFRELRQNADGTLDVVWPKDVATPVKEPDVYRFGANESARIAYRSVQGRKPLVLAIDAKAKTAAWDSAKKPHSACHAEDFTIRNVGGLDRPYEVRVAVWYDERHDVTVFDAEIAGRRTMLTRRYSRYERGE